MPKGERISEALKEEEFEIPSDWRTYVEKRIKSRKDWYRFYARYLEPICGEATERDLNRAEKQGLLWRGMDPDHAFKILIDHQDIGLESEHLANVTEEWRKSLPYGYTEKYPFNVVLGFRPRKDWEIRSAEERLPKDIPEEARKYERGNYNVKGELGLDDVVFIAVRFKGKEKGKPEEPLYYFVDRDKLEKVLEKEKKQKERR